MHRKSFLFGLLAGTLLGVTVAITANTMSRQPATPARVPATPVQYIVAPAPPDAVPPNWGKRQFNGRPYYIVPLGRQARES